MTALVPVAPLEPLAPVPGGTAIASPIPFGFGSAGATPGRAALAAAMQNIGQAGYAWRVLSQGVSDTSAFGVVGLRDHTLPGRVLEPERLRSLRRHTEPALTPSDLTRVAHLRSLSREGLLELGRLPFPFIRRAGDRGFERASWSEALALAGDALDGAAGHSGWVIGDRQSLETSFALAKTARAFDSEQLLRAGPPVVTGPLEEALGEGTSTCSLTDIVGADLVVLFGSIERHPLLARYLRAAKERGSRVVVFAEAVPAELEAAWSPGSLNSLLFGTRLVDDVVPVAREAVQPVLDAILKGIVAAGAHDTHFVEHHTTGFAAVQRHLGALDLRELERTSGVHRGQLEWLVELFSRARNLVSLYDGLPTGAVRSLVNLHLATGAIGRPLTGLLPLLSGPGVPGARLAGFRPPAADADLPSVVTAFGADLTPFGQRLDAVRTRIHAATHLDASMLVEPGEQVVLLPLQSIYEQRGGGLFGSVDRRVVHTPELPDHPIVGASRPAWEVAGQLASTVRPDAPSFRTTRALREALVAEHPAWSGIVDLRDSVQIHGPLIGEAGRFPHDDHRARFTT